MKIINDKHNSFQTTCKKCDSLLQVSPEDLQGGDVSGIYINCPCCNNAFLIEGNKIPKHILQKRF